MEIRPLGSLNRARIQSQPQLTSHGPRDVSGSGGEFYFVNLQVEGTCVATQAGTLRSLWGVDPPAPSACGELEQSFAGAVAAALCSHVKVPAGARRDALRAQVLQLVRSRLADPGLSVALACRELSISPRLLHKLFEGDGQSFAATVRALRLERAARLLSDTPTLLTEVAARCGFTDPAAFSRAFRRSYGVCPREMRAASGRPATLPDRARR